MMRKTFPVDGGENEDSDNDNKDCDGDGDNHRPWLFKRLCIPGGEERPSSWVQPDQARPQLGPLGPVYPPLQMNSTPSCTDG